MSAAHEFRFDGKVCQWTTESLYYQATIKPARMVSSGGIPVDNRWWKAIEEAYRQGHLDTLAGLHGRGAVPAFKVKP